MKLKFFLLFGFMALLFSCNEQDATEKAVAKIPVDLDVIRFDQLFVRSKADAIPDLKQKFPYLFPRQYADSVWIARLTDTLQLEIYSEIEQRFGDFGEQEQQLDLLFKHIKYYFPKYVLPKVVTIISDVQYDNRVVLTDSLLLVGLDNYLGREHRFYAGLPNYVAKNLDAKFLMSDIASAFAKTINRYPRNRSFLSRMVYYGKELYIKELLIPSNSEAQKINYTEEEIEWANTNEEQIWRYFVERELLFSTDSKLDRRFLDPAPFSKFQLELDSESPGRLGRFIGWKIVKAFMERNPKITLIELLDLPADIIFKKSNYKPKK
ncbi:gliding motility lipoprotein GldB [Croceitalea sp. MTPC5]|nr:gliding motility lipoprotein GldB [Croceitalea sp. MTPC5]